MNKEVKKEKQSLEVIAIKDGYYLAERKKGEIFLYEGFAKIKVLDEKGKGSWMQPYKGESKKPESKKPKTGNKDVI